MTRRGQATRGCNRLTNLVPPKRRMKTCHRVARFLLESMDGHQAHQQTTRALGSERRRLSELIMGARLRRAGESWKVSTTDRHGLSLEHLPDNDRLEGLATRPGVPRQVGWLVR
jgi:hypothetical protein